MAFTLRNLENHSGSGAGPKIWSYDANAAGDNIAAATAADYFLDASDLLSVGDKIYIYATDGYTDRAVATNTGSALTVAALT